MEAAAESIRGLRSILPDRPHQLAKSPDWVARQESQHPNYREELQDIRLGYMTFLSEGDRGVLLTRGYDDIRPPAKPMPKEVNALAKTGAAKKLSVNDYLKKKSNASSPDLTPVSTPKKTDSAPVTPKPPGDRLKPPSTDTSSGRLKMPADGQSVEKRLPSKPPTLPPKPPTPDDVRKRSAPDDGGRPLKRSRPSDVDLRAKDDRAKEDRAKDKREKDGRASDERARDGPNKGERARNDRANDEQARDEPPRRKTQEALLSRDTPASKEKEKSTRDRDQTSGLANGRSMLKAVTSSRASSPPPRVRGNSVNGVTNGSESTRGSGSKGDSQKSNNSSVPRLLSPLRLSIGDNDKAADARLEKRRRAEEPVPTKAKTTKPADLQQPSAKRPRIPELLSPTLPPTIEAELNRIKKKPQKEIDHGFRDDRGERDLDRERDPDRERDRDGEREANKQKKKDAPAVGRRAADDEVQSTKSQASSSLVVTLKIPKNLRQQFRYMMKLTTQSRSSTLGVGRAEKRPASLGETGTEASKRPRVALPVPLPSTPSKKGAPAMSRVSSNNSMANTPGDAIAATPNVPPDSAERNSHAELKGKDRARLQLLKDKEAEFQKLGRDLKHKSDAFLSSKNKGPPNGIQQPPPRSQSDVKAAWAQLLESLLCFVMSFHCSDIQRQLLNKAKDSALWGSIGPLAHVLDLELRNKPTRDAPMAALKTLCQMIVNDQFLAAIASQGDLPIEGMSKIMRCERSRVNLLAQLRKANEAIEVDNLRVKITPWALEDTVADMLRVTRRWCADEGVKWSPTLNLKDCGVKE